MERAVAGLLAESHLMPPESVADALARHARPLGVHTAVIYLAELQQLRLHPMPVPASAGPRAPLAIDATMAGRAFQSIRMLHLPIDGGLHRVWLPLMDGTERLGVIELVAEDVGDAMLDRYRTLAYLTGMLVVSKSAYSDTYARIRRGREMALQAEMAWAFMAPPSFATEQVAISAVLEPAYEVGGDAFDYTLLGDHLHISLLDAAGHDLAAGLIASVAMASCRNVRRGGGDLAELVTRTDKVIATEFGDSRFATAILADFDVTSGDLRWVACGHPPPLLIRDKRVVMELARLPTLPLGIGDDMAPQVHHEQLEPGDRVLLYTDGVVEGRGADGRPFGVDRLGDFVIRHSAEGMASPETLRRLNRTILEYQRGRLADDATTMLLEWMPDRPGEQLRF